MKIVVKGVEMHLLQADHMLIIFEPDAIIFKCTLCAGTKDIHYLCTINSEQPLPYGWMKTCTCNAPHTGGDTQPLPDEGEPEPEQVQPVSSFVAGPIVSPLHIPIPMGFPARFVEREQ